MSKDVRYAGSQSITTLGIVEQVTEVKNADDLVRATAKRSVFSAADLGAMASLSDTLVKLIDFLLVGHVEPSISLQRLTEIGVLSAAPQSIMRLDKRGYLTLRQHLQLGLAL
jgi:hypothetical protein